MSLCCLLFLVCLLAQKQNTEQTEMENNNNEKKKKRQVRNENIYDSCVDQQLNEKVGEGESERDGSFLSAYQYLTFSYEGRKG